MKKRTQSRVFLFIMCFSVSSAANAFQDSRNEKWEFFLAPQFVNSKSLQFGHGSEADISARSGLGFGMGYNVNKHIELSLLLSSSSANYTGTRVPDGGSNTPEKFAANLYTSNINFGFTFNLLKTPFTPYISGNIGSTYIDSGIPTGNLGTVCWWDPWWGYICSPTAQTYTSTRFNYGAEVGLRYDFSRKFFIKGGIGENLIDINSSNTANFISYRFIFGLMF